MLIDGQNRTTIWPDPEGEGVFILDQTRLPHVVSPTLMRGLDDAVRAIRDMQVRGAPLIGVTAAFGMALAMRESVSDEALRQAAQCLRETRPTAVNLQWALSRMTGLLSQMPGELRQDAASPWPKIWRRRTSPATRRSARTGSN